MDNHILSENENIHKLPFLTSEYPGMEGWIKTKDDDFIVEEIPAYEFAGHGDHVCVLIEKKGMTTQTAVSKLSNELHIQKKYIGFAGLKDAHAITKQWISLGKIRISELENLKIHNLRILKYTRHIDKIHLGDLQGNKFSISLRDISIPLKDAIHRIEVIMKILAKRGVPNYFGPQRFGNRSDSHLLGYAILKDDIDEFLRLFLGSPKPSESNILRVARKHYESGEYRKALQRWPYSFTEQRRALKILADTHNKIKAYSAIDNTLKRFLVSAFQSYIFNKVLAARMPEIDQLYEGDIVYDYSTKTYYPVEDLTKEQVRCSNFEISPTGPLPGIEMQRLKGLAGKMENDILDSIRLTSNQNHNLQFYGQGERRPLRFQAKNCSVSLKKDSLGRFIHLQFELPPGCYATTLLREFTKEYKVD